MTTPPTPFTNLTDVVYKSFMETEVKREQGTLGGTTTEMYLSGIKTIDNLPVKVYIGMTFGDYSLRIESEDLITDSGGNYDDLIYYIGRIMEYSATREYEKILEDKQEGAAQHNRMKIVTKKDVELCIKKLIVILNELKFNNYVGRFMDLDHYIPHDIYDIFKSPNVTIVEGDECVVCYETTLIKTWCNHPVCYRCTESIPSKENNDGLSKPCPVCRADMIYPHHPQDD